MILPDGPNRVCLATRTDSGTSAGSGTDPTMPQRGVRPDPRQTGERAGNERSWPEHRSRARSPPSRPAAG